MASNAEFDEDLMYTTWVASKRNARVAAETLGMNYPTFRYHVTNKNFAGRYLADFGGAAEQLRKMHVYEMYAKIPVFYKVLEDIALHGSSDLARVAAVREFFRSLPPLEAVKLDPDRAASMIDTTGILQDADNVEGQIKFELENNIVGALEARTRKGK